MTEAIIVALVTAGASVLCQAMISKRSSDLLQYRIGQLEEKMTKHNNLVERMALVERDMKAVFRVLDQIPKEGRREHEQN